MLDENRLQISIMGENGKTNKSKIVNLLDGNMTEELNSFYTNLIRIK